MKGVEDVLPNHVGTEDDARGRVQEGHCHPDGEDGVLLAERLAGADAVVAAIAKSLTENEVEHAEEARVEDVYERCLEVDDAHAEYASDLSTVDADAD